MSVPSFLSNGLKFIQKKREPMSSATILLLQYLGLFNSFFFNGTCYTVLWFVTATLRSVSLFAPLLD